MFLILWRWVKLVLNQSKYNLNVVTSKPGHAHVSVLQGTDVGNFSFYDLFAIFITTSGPGAIFRSVF